MYVFALIFGVVLWLGVLFAYLRHPASSVFHPGTYYLVFQGLIFVLRPILAHTLQYDDLYALYNFQPSMADKVTVLLGADLAFVVFMAASLRFGPDSFDELIARRRADAPTPVLDRGFVATWVLCAPLAIASLAADIGQKTSGVTNMVVDAGTGNALNTTGIGYFTDVQFMLIPLVILTAWLGRMRFWSLVPLFAFILLRASTGGRGSFVMAAASLMVIYLLTIQRRWLSARILAGGVGILALFRVIGDDRGAAIRTLLGLQASRGDGGADALRPLESMDYGNMEFFEYLVWIVPDKTKTYTYFTELLGLFTEPVPRALWPGKPVGSPIRMFNLFDYGQPIGMTFSMPGSGWAALGWIGIVLYALGYGWFYGRLYRHFARNPAKIGFTAIYIILLPLSLIAFRDGSVVSIVKSALFSIIPILIWRLFSRIGAPPEARVVAHRPEPSATRQRIEARRRDIA